VTALGIEAVVASTNGRIPTPAIEAHSPIGESSPTTSIGVGLDEIVARTGHDADVLERVLAEEVEVGNVVVVDGLFALAPDGLDPEIVRALQQITPLNILGDPEPTDNPKGAAMTTIAGYSATTRALAARELRRLPVHHHAGLFRVLDEDFARRDDRLRLPGASSSARG
jgi:hypothetical protein